jgi:hypothetical protein
MHLAAGLGFDAWLAIGGNLLWIVLWREAVGARWQRWGWLLEWLGCFGVPRHNGNILAAEFRLPFLWGSVSYAFDSFTYGRIAWRARLGGLCSLASARLAQHKKGARALIQAATPQKQPAVACSLAQLRRQRAVVLAGRVQR